MAHIGRGAGAALDHVDHELVVELTLNDACAGGADGRVLGGGQVAQLAVGVGGSLLDHRQGDHQLGVVAERHAAEAEVVHGAQGLDAVPGVGRHFEAAEQVFFDTEGCSSGHDGGGSRDSAGSAAMPID